MSRRDTQETLLCGMCLGLRKEVSFGQNEGIYLEVLCVYKPLWVSEIPHGDVDKRYVWRLKEMVSRSESKGRQNANNGNHISELLSYTI